MRIGLLLPTILASQKFSKDRIFAPLNASVDLADGLIDKGHQVFFYTASDVNSKAQIISGDDRLIENNPIYYQFRFRSEEEKKFATAEIIKRDFEYDLTQRCYKDALEGKLDVVHSYHDFGAHYFDQLTNFPTIYTLHDPLPQTADTLEYLRFSKFTHHNFVSISNSQRKSILSLNFINTVYHGLNLKNYEFDDSPDDYFIYFGRLIEDKGADIAIKLSLELGIPLHLATSLSISNRNVSFYKEKIEPFIDGEKIVLRGYLERKDKSDFIKKAKAFIFPLRWEEPFGLTIIEAMACGTPVIAYNRGSISELIKDGVTGFVVDPKKGEDGLRDAISRIDEIDRNKCRQWVEDNFTLEKMINSYEKIYQEVINK